MPGQIPRHGAPTRNESIRNQRAGKDGASPGVGWLHEIEQLGKKFLEYLTQFWVNYNALKGKQFNIRDVHGPEHASHTVQKASKH